ncbi:hypothetical protein MSC49_36610 [Methylosinus sp. C49]|uniref:hypothetical protein n=1 Tax=Methylosinus sp. C49 TaxID=2699395 RepID=UPI001366CBB3|nr:hypothetical protein [Methylosinus sp. C49]BBU63726.1 hypothetical protein MSC49_36610 [Methylosinus sp. C49]
MPNDEKISWKDLSITRRRLSAVRATGQCLAYTVFLLVFLPVMIALALAAAAFETEELREL